MSPEWSERSKSGKKEARTDTGDLGPGSLGFILGEMESYAVPEIFKRALWLLYGTQRLDCQERKQGGG